MSVLNHLEPQNVFHFFEELAGIPRPSRHEEAVSHYLITFAKKRGLEFHSDQLGNVIIIKEASAGYENCEPIILQGHMDMVCEKEPGVRKDMDKEGVDLEINGDYISARGTTLGGDDGIAAAYALALLDSDSLQHPRLEFVCTVGEEIGMVGAKAIDLSPLKGHLLLNLDSEEEGIVLAGCAGGGTANVSLPIHREPCSWEPIAIRISGLTGGHSGSDIDKSRASSVTLCGRVLRRLKKVTDLRLIEMENGTKDNAISREGRMQIAIEHPDAALKALDALQAELRAEYEKSDPGLQLEQISNQYANESLSGSETPDNQYSSRMYPLDEESTIRVISMLTALPQGIQRMSLQNKGLVETSLNWGSASLVPEQFHMKASLRSAVGTAYRALADQTIWIADSFGASCVMTGEYPAWEWVEHSQLRDRMARIYSEMFGRKLVIETIHAGVECGLLSEKIPGMDAVSMGPDILDIHTPNERLSISSVQRMWDFIVRIIEDKD